MWSDLREKLESIHDEHLSNNKLAVNNVKLSFEFPFYGHMVSSATLTTGGKRQLHVLVKILYISLKTKIILRSFKRNPQKHLTKHYG